MHAHAGKAAEGLEYHPVAADEQKQDRNPDPGKEFLEGDPHEPQALRWLERAERGTQADIDRKHAADPDDGPEDVQGESKGGHGRTPRFEALARLHAALCAPLASAEAPPARRDGKTLYLCSIAHACATSAPLFRRTGAAQALQQRLMKCLRCLHLRRVTEFREFDQCGIGMVRAA